MGPCARSSGHPSELVDRVLGAGNDQAREAFGLRVPRTLRWRVLRLPDAVVRLVARPLNLDEDPRFRVSNECARIVVDAHEQVLNAAALSMQRLHRVSERA